MTAKIVVLTAVVALLAPPVAPVDRSKFRTCDQSAFCKRARSMSAGATSDYALDPATLTVGESRIEAVLVRGADDIRFRLEITGLVDSSYRVRVREVFPLVPRFEVPYVVDGEPETSNFEVKAKSEEGFTLVNAADSTKIVLSAKPLRIDFYSGEELVLTLNGKGQFRFEQTREKPAEGALDGEWEESFSGNTDSKPHGPQAVAMDVTFHGADDIFGIPEHADNFNLKDTVGASDPYRLYNLDVFEYELWNPMALYAAIPLVFSHSETKTAGVFWLNAAETWVDVQRSNSGVLGSLSNLVSSEKSSVTTHFMSESGIIEVYVFLGPRPKDVSRQYGKITGTTPLPPEFSLAYHQCRWNYNDQEDVQTVNTKFDEHDIPMDIMWLDIEHTDGKKYFTWDGRKFPDSLSMVNSLSAVGRKLVTIVDPHIKKDNNYWVHKELTDLGLYTKTKEGNDYEGWCWPGASYYPDFLNPAAREYFAAQYALDKYKGTNLDVFTWNDMNEPSVFNGPEVTMPKDLIHHGGFEHRDMHNMYGHLYVMGTHAGHLLRSEGKQRPFILTRSAFAGSQRYAAIWTGDNTAGWDHLTAATPMCLSLSIAGMSFVGADVGGFFGNPDGELMVRWYQTAAFQPFFRSHAHIDSKRREPWTFNDSEMALIRKAIRTRYTYLPLWYTLFYEGETTAAPPMRPVWYNFPEDKAGFKVEDTFMVGDALLVRPVTESGAKSVNVYFPSGARWYDIYDYKLTEASGYTSVPVTYDHAPVYQKGGSIVPKKERVRRSSALMRDDPITLIVALDAAGTANGTLYTDDGMSFEYQEQNGGNSLYAQFVFENNRLIGTQLKTPTYASGSWIEKVLVVGVASDVSGGVASLVTPSGKEEKLKTTFDASAGVLTIRKPGVNIGEEWEIKLGGN